MINPEEQPQDDIYYFIENKVSHQWLSRESIGLDNQLQYLIYTQDPNEALKFYLHHKASSWMFMNKLRTDHVVTQHMFV